MSAGIPAAIQEQLSEPPYQMPGLLYTDGDYLDNDCRNWECNVEARWWIDVLTGQDQLNQRVAFLLSQIFSVNFQTVVDPRYEPHYLNALSADALTNWFTIMHDMTLDPSVGQYVGMLNSAAPAPGAHAEENFARENLQIFNLGVFALEMDGTYKLDSAGNPIPNYSPDQIQGFARAFTGWTFADYHQNCAIPRSFQNYWWPDTPGQNCPMVPIASLHDSGAKELLRGVVLPAGQSAEEDLEDALHNIFEDPSLPPFISKRLIQGLVTSNPNPDYVRRISEVFVDNGAGIRGDMKAVVKAILLDPDARAGDSGSSPTAGRVREPVLQYSAMLRALASQTPNVTDTGVFQQRLCGWIGSAGERVHGPPSVFGFFQPDFNITVAGQTLYAPEAQLDNNQNYQQSTEWMTDMLANDWENQVSILTLQTSKNTSLGAVAEYQGPQALVDWLNVLLMHGDMPDSMQAIIVQAITGLDPTSMVEIASFLTLMSGQYRVIQ
jgi:uncharacterized protein (DUF1800 family)